MEIINAEMTELGKQIIDNLNLNNKGFNITNVVGNKKGTRVLFIKVKHDSISFTQSFDNSWASGIQLNFRIEENVLKFHKKGAFGWRNDEYDTPSNNGVVEKLISELDGYSL